MAGARGGRSVAAMTKTPPLAIAICALVASYAIGAAIALANGIGEIGDVLGNGRRGRVRRGRVRARRHSYTTTSGRGLRAITCRGDIVLVSSR
jgi:hypothetical protein